MPDEPRDEREVQAAIEVHTPLWLPGVTAKLSYKRIYEKRAADFFQSVANLAGMGPEELADLITESGRTADLLNATLPRALERGDDKYTDLLGALVAAALLDAAKFDETAYLVDRIVKLEPIHIRVLNAADNVKEINEDQALVELEKVRDNISIHEGIIETCFYDMVDVGFMATHNDMWWRISSLGQAALIEIYRARDMLQAG